MQILIQNVIKNIAKQYYFDVLKQREEFVEFPQLEGDLANFFEHYLDMVNLLLNIMRFQRTNNWEGCIEALEIFFSCNPDNFTRNLSTQYIQTKYLGTSHPSAQIFLKEEGFIVLFHSKIPMNQVIKMTVNRSTTETGLLTAKTENPGACPRWKTSK